MSPDPYDGSYDPMNPQSLNRYSYAEAQPLGYIDPSGLLSVASPGGSTTYCGCGSDWIGIDSFIFFGVGSGGGGASGGSGGGSGGGGGGAGAGAPSLLHIIGCSIAAPVLGAAQVTNHVAGVGVGGSAGAGVILGLFGALGIQVVADPQGNAGLAINVTGGGFGFGIGAQAGGQYSASTAHNISELSGGPALDVSGSFGPVGLDVSHAPGGATTATATLGPGVGGKVSGGIGASYTGIPISTNCKDMFP